MHRERVTTAIGPQREDLRVSDRERDEVVSLLRVHAGEGRLSIDELSERIDVAHGARTRGELARVVADLPSSRGPRRRAARRAEFVAHARSYGMVMVLLVVIWAVTGAGYFWPVWPMLGWGIGLFSHGAGALGPAGRRSCGRHHRRVSGNASA